MIENTFECICYTHLLTGGYCRAGVVQRALSTEEHQDGHRALLLDEAHLRVDKDN